jgi:hypothetical protein
MSDIFGRLKSGAEKVAFEADKMSRLSRAKSEVDKLKDQLQGQYAKLGEKYFTERQTGEVTGVEFDELCQAITDLQQQVDAKLAEVQKIDGETYGAAAVQPATQPAPAPVQPQVASPQPGPTPSAPPVSEKSTRFCPNCGSELPLETKFCTNCGSKV